MNIKKILSLEGIFVILLFILFCYLFVENFVFSESYEMTQFRLADDYSFNETIYRIQSDLKELNIKGIFSCNDFAYGWIFWALHGIITFPFYLLGWEQMTIATLRNISLIMSFASLFLIYKILGFYTKNKFYKITVIVSILSTGVFAIYSMHFDTTAMIQFFGLLSIYCIIRDKNLSKKTLILSAIFLGISVATKVIGAVFVLIAGLLLLDRLKGNSISIKLKKTGLFSVVFFTSTIFFTNPELFLFFILKDELLQEFEYYNYFANKLTFTSSININGWIFTLTDQFYKNELTILFLLLYFVKIIRDLINKKFDYIYYLLGIVILPILFLFIDEGNSNLIFIKYYAVTMILLPLSLIELEHYKKIGYFIASIILVIAYINILVSLRPIYIDSPPISKKIITYNLFYEIQNYFKKNNDITLYYELHDLIIGNDSNTLKTVCYNETVPAVSVESIRRNLLYDYSLNWENVLYSNVSISNECDYYLIRREAYRYVPEDMTEEYIKKVDVLISQLINNNIYSKIYDKYDTVVYKKIEQ